MIWLAEMLTNVPAEHINVQKILRLAKILSVHIRVSVLLAIVAMEKHVMILTNARPTMVDVIRKVFNQNF